MNQIIPTYQVTFQVPVGSHTHDATLRVPANELGSFLGILAFNNVPVFHVEREKL